MKTCLGCYHTTQKKKPISCQTCEYDAFGLAAKASAEHQARHPFHADHPSKSRLIFSHVIIPLTPFGKIPKDNPWVYFFFPDELSLEKTLQNTGKNWKFLGTNSPTGVLRAIRKRGKSWRFYYSSPHTPHKNMHKKFKKMWFLGRAKVVLFKSHFLVCYGSLAEVIGDCSGLQEATSLPPPFTHHALC